MQPLLEKSIIEEFKRHVEERFPGELVRLIIFGSKVRGEATPDSDVDLLAVIQSDNWRLGDKIRVVGYALELEHGVVLSIQVISRDHYERLRANRTQFFHVLEQEGVVVMTASIDAIVDESWRNSRGPIEGRSSFLIGGRSRRSTSEGGSQDR